MRLCSLCDFALNPNPLVHIPKMVGPRSTGFRRDTKILTQRRKSRKDAKSGGVTNKILAALNFRSLYDFALETAARR